MKIKDGFLLSEIDDSGIVVATGDASKDFNGIVTLNQTGIFLWKILEGGADEADLIKALTSEYDIDEKTAAEDVKDFLNTLKGADLLEGKHVLS